MTCSLHSVSYSWARWSCDPCFEIHATICCWQQRQHTNVIGKTKGSALLTLSTVWFAATFLLLQCRSLFFFFLIMLNRMIDSPTSSADCGWRGGVFFGCYCRYCPKRPHRSQVGKVIYRRTKQATQPAGVSREVLQELSLNDSSHQ